jgi:hypothetical protein
MKADGAEKAGLTAHVDELLALKARYQELTGEAWAAAPASEFPCGRALVCVCGCEGAKQVCSPAGS